MKVKFAYIKCKYTSIYFYKLLIKQQLWLELSIPAIAFILFSTLSKTRMLRAACILTSPLYSFFVIMKKKYSTLFYKCRVTNCHLKYDKALYKLFKILVVEFTIKYGIFSKNTDIFPKNTNTSLINL